MKKRGLISTAHYNAIDALDTVFFSRPLTGDLELLTLFSRFPLNTGVVLTIEYFTEPKCDSSSTQLSQTDSFFPPSSQLTWKNVHYWRIIGMFLIYLIFRSVQRIKHVRSCLLHFIHWGCYFSEAFFADFSRTDIARIRPAHPIEPLDFAV